MGAVEYKNCYVAFVDILGFKEWVNKSDKSPDNISEIQDVLDIFVSEKENNLANVDFVRSIRNGRHVTIFSDSIVISYNAENVNAGYHLLMDLSYITVQLLDKGVMVRGGATYGKLMHDEQYCYGPAMNKAYLLESEVAIYPRIVLSDNYQFETIKTEDGYEIDNCIATDRDGIRFIDFMKVIAWDEEICTQFTCKALKHLDIKNTEDEKIQMKYDWLRDYISKW